uniref:Uncharacterized protein n=1 Tax=Anguilla anguilla TaxID=7936 RepID=A0A0E9TGG3_ANGAN
MHRYPVGIMKIIKQARFYYHCYSTFCISSKIAWPDKTWHTD